MSDVMFYGVLRMPYELAMSSEMSRRQFYGRAQEAADRVAQLEAERRAAPSSPVADDGLPKPAISTGNCFPNFADGADQPYYTADQMRQAQREAYEAGRQSTKARVMHLTHERDLALAANRSQQPAAVHDLIAEVERLSAALQARIEEGKDNA